MNERMKSVLDWREPQSLQRLCVLAVARSVAGFVDNAILGHIFKKELEFDEVVNLIRQKFDQIVGGDLPAELSFKIIDCTWFLSSSAGFLLSSMCASFLGGIIATEPRCLSLPPKFIDQCIRLSDSSGLITSFDATGIEFSDDILISLASSKSADSLRKLRTDHLRLSAISEPRWRNFKSLDTIVLNQLEHITMGMFDGMAQSPTLSTLEIHSLPCAPHRVTEIVRIILAPTAAPNLRRFEFLCRPSSSASNLDFEQLLTPRPHLDRWEKLPFAFPLFGEENEFQNEQSLKFLVDHCPNIDLSIPTRQSVSIRFESLVDCPEWVFEAMKQPHWNIVSSDIGTQLDRKLGIALERLKRLNPDLRRLEVTAGTILTETDLRPFSSLVELRIHSQVVSAPIVFPENLRALEFVIESPVHQPHLEQALKSVSTLSQMDSLKVRIVCPLSISTYLDAIVRSLTNLTVLEFTTPSSDADPPPHYIVSHPNLRRLSNTYLGRTHCSAGQLPSLLAADQVLGPFDPVLQPNMQFLRCDFMKFSEDDAQIALHKMMNFANLRFLSVQHLKPSGISQLSGFSTLQTLIISKCEFDEKTSSRRFLTNMPWLTRLSLTEVTVHHLEFLQHPLLQTIQAVIRFQVKMTDADGLAMSPASALILSPATLPMLKFAYFSVVGGVIENLDVEELDYLTELHVTLSGRRSGPGSRCRASVERCDRLEHAGFVSTIFDRLRIDSCGRLSQLKLVNCNTAPAKQDQAFEVTVPKKCEIIGTLQPEDITYV